MKRKKMTNIGYFDVRAYLDSKNVEYKTEGKNVSEGWIGIRCLWCDDKSNHLGINLTSKAINCFRCSVDGTIIRLIMRLEYCTFNKAVKIIKQFSSRELYHTQKGFEITQISNEYLRISEHEQTQKELLETHRDYLISRDFNPEEIYDYYELRSFGPTAENRYRNRIYIPFFLNDRLVSFTAMDITEESTIPYMHCPDHESAVPIKATLYNIDRVNDTVIFVEGCTDVWRIGDGSVATCGTQYTSRQLRLIASMDISRAFVLFDSEDEAQQIASHLAYDLSSIIGDVQIVELGDGDPADLKADDVKHLRTEIFGKYF